MVIVAVFVVLSIVAPRLPGLRDPQPSRRSMRRFSVVWSARWLAFCALCILIAVGGSWWPIRLICGVFAVAAVGCAVAFAWSGRHLGTITDDEYTRISRQ